jgi:transcriptional regulator with XRE-family HTH domain
MTILIGQKVKLLREKAKLNQEQLAQYLSVDQSLVSKCEKGDRQFQVDQLEKLGNLFGCSLNELMADVDRVNPLSIAFRADSIGTDDLVAIADIHRIALNLVQMRTILDGAEVEK